MNKTNSCPHRAYIPVGGKWQTLCNQIKNPAVVKSNFRNSGQQVTLELCRNDLNEEKQPFMRSVIGIVLRILYTISCILPFYSERISCLFRLDSTELKFKPFQFFRLHTPPNPATLDFMPLNLLAEILFLTLCNRFFLTIPVAQPSFSLQSFPWPKILHYFPSSDQPRHRSLFLPLVLEHSVWDLSCNEIKIHYNSPFIFHRLAALSRQGPFVMNVAYEYCSLNLAQGLEH